MMERDTLSFFQLMALLFGALFAPAAELLPGDAARAGAMGACGVLAAGIALVLSGLLTGRLSSRPGGLAGGLTAAFGPGLGRGILFLYMVWFQLLLTLRLRLSAQRLSSGGARDGAVWFFLLVLGGLALWMARGHLGALGRAAQLFFTALWVTAAAVLLLSLTQGKGGNLLPDQSVGVAQLLSPGFCALGYGLFGAFLYQKGEERCVRRWLVWSAGAALALVVMQLIVVGRFGPQLAARLDSPFFHLAKSVGVEGAFQRVESLAAAIWVFSDLLLLAGLLWCMRRIGAALCPGLPAPALVTVAVLAAMVLALAVFGQRVSPAAAQSWLLPAGGVVLGLAVPAWAVFVEERKSHP